MADNETTEDVIAWLRRPREGENAYLTLWRDEIADRLESAHKRDTKELRVEIERLKEERNYSGVRERERLRAKGFAIVPKEQLERGDAAKLREAVKKVLDAVKHLSRTHNDDLPEDVRAVLGGIAFDANAALKTPPRNCDVGTPEEQLKRKRTHCKAQDCRTCPFYGNDSLLCAFRLAQTTYKEGVNDGNE